MSDNNKFKFKINYRYSIRRIGVQGCTLRWFPVRALWAKTLRRWCAASERPRCAWLGGKLPPRSTGGWSGAARPQSGCALAWTWCASPSDPAVHLLFRHLQKWCKLAYMHSMTRRVHYMSARKWISLYTYHILFVFHNMKIDRFTVNSKWFWNKSQKDTISKITFSFFSSRLHLLLQIWPNQHKKIQRKKLIFETFSKIWSEFCKQNFSIIYILLRD